MESGVDRKLLQIVDNLAIQAPCSEDPSKMKQRVYGAHCSSCQRAVWDTSRMSRNQVRVLLALTGGNCCARIKRDSHGSIVFAPTVFSTHWKSFIKQDLSVILSALFGFLYNLHASDACATSHTSGFREKAISSHNVSLKKSGADLQQASLPQELIAKDSAPDSVYARRVIKYDVGGRVTEPLGLWALLLIYIEGSLGALFMTLSMVGAAILCPISLIRKNRTIRYSGVLLAIISALLASLRWYY